MAARVKVFMNENSGTCKGRRPEIEQAFLRQNLPCDIIPLRPGGDLARQARAAAAVPGAILVAAGGDGTMNAVANVLAGAPACMGVLPMGTLNHFAKDLGIPVDLEDAVATIARGATRPVDAGEVNGRIFVNNSSLGFYPGMVLQRERLKKVGWNKWLSLTVATLRALIRFRHIAVCVTVPDPGHPGQTLRLNRTTPFVFIGNNEYTMESAAAGSRKRLDGGRLYLYMAPGATRLSLLALTFAALRHRVSEAAHFESLCVEECTVTLRRPVSRVSLDGEVVRLKGPLRYRIRPGALQVLAPPPAPPNPE